MGDEKKRMDLVVIPAMSEADVKSLIPKVAIPEKIHDPEVWKGAVKYQFWYSLAGLVLGLVCIVSGVVLFLHGVVGTTKSWTASVLGLKNSVSDVPAGVVVFIVGMIIVFITRFVVKPQR